MDIFMKKNAQPKVRVANRVMGEGGRVEVSVRYRRNLGGSIPPYFTNSK